MPLECKSSIDSASYICHVQIGLFPKPKVCICLFSLTVKKILFLTLTNIILHIVEILIYVIFSNQNIALFSSVPVSGLFLCIYSRFGSLKLCIHLFSQEKSQLHSYRYLTDDGCIIFKRCQTFILILIRPFRVRFYYNRT